MKQINLNFEGKTYTLEYTRKTVEAMERNGFNINNIRDMPMVTLPTLFRGAFMANHKYVKQGIIDSIYDRISDKTELIGKLAELYNEPLEALLAEPEADEGNATWTASW